MTKTKELVVSEETPLRNEPIEKGEKRGRNPDNTALLFDDHISSLTYHISCSSYSLKKSKKEFLPPTRKPLSLEAERGRVVIVVCLRSILNSRAMVRRSRRQFEIQRCSRCTRTQSQLSQHNSSWNCWIRVRLMRCDTFKYNAEYGVRSTKSFEVSLLFQSIIIFHRVTAEISISKHNNTE